MDAIRRNGLRVKGGIEMNKCVKCKHPGMVDSRGRCVSVYRDAGGSLVNCGCKCEFTPVEQSRTIRVWVEGRELSPSEFTVEGNVIRMS